MKSKGFTLVELVLILMIIAILFVVAVTACPQRIAMAAETTSISDCSFAVLDVIAPAEECPVKQMLENSDLTAHIIYLKADDWTDEDVDIAIKGVNSVSKRFTDAGVESFRIIPTFTNTPDWRKGINLDKGNGLYIVLK